ncbi:ABC transporter ATP-binding protein [uncultured Gulosibacter sp.]|uniref:ABC transporter ATP-binding protein n=1 Tax=uncultured Gulosibacter sp. TaxID=1339167 RepID=UPI002889E09A|nr:ABC transporter ATP-binding protein [uncultured Gulosibacter sp.]
MTTENEHAVDDEARGEAEHATKSGNSTPFNLVAAITVDEGSEVASDQELAPEPGQLEVVEEYAEWTVVTWIDPAETDRSDADASGADGSGADGAETNNSDADGPDINVLEAEEFDADDAGADGAEAESSESESEPEIELEPDDAEATEQPASANIYVAVDAPAADAEVPADVNARADAEPSTQTPATQMRDLRLGQQTAEGLATMTPVAMQTAAADRDYGDTVLQITEVSKSFGSKRALNGVSYGIRQGSFSGLVGPNGAGKTTLLNIISGLLPPSKGSVTIAGTDVWKSRREAAQRIGVLPDRLRMFEHLTGAQYLTYVGSIRGLNRDQTLERTDALIDQFELRSSANRLVTDYSAGMRKKLALAATLIHSPQLLVLDEPFETIDPVSASVLIDVLIDYADRGGTVLLSSHSMDLVQRTCDHVVVIVDGEVLAEGTVEEVRDGITLEERFRNLVRGPEQTTGLDWLEISFG